MAQTRSPGQPSSPRTPERRENGWLTVLAAPGLILLAIVCCAGPLLLAALLATGAGAWLAANGYLIGAVALFVIAAVVAWRIQARMSR